jgi:hypothetical protein
MRRALAALAASLLLSAPAARAGDSLLPTTVPPPIAVITVPPKPAPDRYIEVPWRNPDGTMIDGWWYSSPQVTRIDARIRYLETAAAKECVDQQVAAAKATGPWVKVIGGVLAGAAIGYCAAAPKHCGITK